MKNLTTILIILLISITTRAQFSLEVYSGAQYNKIKETKHVFKPIGYLIFNTYPEPAPGFQFGIRPKFVIRDYLSVSNESELGFQYLRQLYYFENTEKLIKTNFINSGLMVGILPFALRKGLHKNLEIKSGAFLNYSFNNQWTDSLYKMPEYNYSFRHALGWRYQAVSAQVYLNYMQKQLLNSMILDQVEFIYHYHSFGFQVSYRLF